MTARKALAFLMLASLPAMAWEELSPMEIKVNEGVTFALDFDAASLRPTRAAGDPSVKCAEPDAASFVEGVKGKAFCAVDKGISLEFKYKDNLSFANPGSVSFWIKPVKWKKPDEMPLEKDGKSRTRFYQPFFLTCYNSQGYLGLQRMTSHLDGGIDTIMLFFACFKGVNAGIQKGLNLAEGQWHNFAMTWDPLVFRLYIDGELVGRCVVDRKIRDEELSANFAVCCSQGTVLDEVFIYDYVLMAEVVKEFYNYRKGATNALQAQ